MSKNLLITFTFSRNSVIKDLWKRYSKNVRKCQKRRHSLSSSNSLVAIATYMNTQSYTET
jgi:hypothetical protein